MFGAVIILTFVPNLTLDQISASVKSTALSPSSPISRGQIREKMDAADALPALIFHSCANLFSSFSCNVLKVLLFLCNFWHFGSFLHF